MADLTRHLGELMGQSEAERQAAQEAATRAAEIGSAPPSATAGNILQNGVDAIGASPVSAPSPEVVASSALDHAAISAHSVSQIAHNGADLSAYAFPFKAHEIFALLPGSLGGKAEGLYGLISELAGEKGNTYSMIVTGAVLFALVLTLIATARVWLRRDEFAVAGFGDRLTRVGMRYSVRQGATMHREVAAGEIISLDASPEISSVGGAAALETPALSLPEPRGPEAAGQWGAAKAKPELPTPEASPAPTLAVPSQVPLPTPKFATEIMPLAEEKISAPTENAQNNAPKSPKTVRRQLLRRDHNVPAFEGQLQGAFGAYEARDRLFAGDYLRATNEAFEAAHFKGKGPRFPQLRLADNHRAERLFMIANRTASEDPSTALAALWQAVEEDQADAVSWLRLAHCYLEHGDREHAERILAPLQSDASKAGLPIIVAAAANTRAKIAAQKGEGDKARKLLSESLDAAKACDNPFIAGITAANLGLMEAARGKPELARTHLTKAVKSLDGAGDSVAAARARMALGTVEMNLGHDKAAHEVWGEAETALYAAKLSDEALQVARWIKGEAAPRKVTL